MARLVNPVDRPWVHLNLLQPQLAERARTQRRWLLAFLAPQLTALATLLAMHVLWPRPDVTPTPTGISQQDDLWWRQRWQSRHDEAHQLMARLVSGTPAGLVLDVVRQQNGQLTLRGQTRHKATLQQFEQTLRQHSPYSRRIRLETSASLFRQQPVRSFDLVLGTDQSGQTGSGQ